MAGTTFAVLEGQILALCILICPAYHSLLLSAHLVISIKILENYKGFCA